MNDIFKVLNDTYGISRHEFNKMSQEVINLYIEGLKEI